MMIVTVPKTGAHPDLPSGISWSRVEDHGDTMTVRIDGEHEQWAVEQGYHTPTRVQPHLLLLAIDDQDPAMLDQIMAMAEQNRQIKIALNHAPSIRRDAEMVEGIRQGLELSHDEVDDLFRAAFVRSV